MSTVYRAHDQRLGRDIALKVLHPQFAADKDFIARFRQEAEFAAGLSTHPNIVSIFDVGEDGDLHYIVMEQVEGRNLKDLIRSEAPLSVDRAFAIGQAIASALAFAHQRGLIHRDIKPQNILVAPDGDVKVTDFGIARSSTATQTTRTGIVLGTAHYIAPEQAQGQPAETASDIYSLGVVVFEMLTGELLFDADNALAIAMKHVHDAPTSPNRLNPNISPGAAAVVLRALNKNPAQRYRSAAEFGLAMQQKDLPEIDQGTVVAPLAGFSGPSETAGQDTVVISRQPPPPTPPAPSVSDAAPPPNPWRTTLLILLALFLIGAASAAGFFVYRNATAVTKPTPTATAKPTKTPKPPTRTPSPTAIPPTSTSVPPTARPTPTSPPPTPTPRPTRTPTPTPTPPQATPTPDPTPFG